VGRSPARGLRLRDTRGTVNPITGAQIWKWTKTSFARATNRRAFAIEQLSFAGLLHVHLRGPIQRST
jgi:hypothetical protein